jgi:flagellar biosynthesis/type III secretory pathway chaperone
MQIDAIAETETMLDQLTVAIREGDLQRIATIGPQLEQVLVALRPELDTQITERLREKACQNATLLQATAKGLRAAQRRIAEIRAAHEGLSTYNARGRRAGAGHRPGAMNWRL